MKVSTPQKTKDSGCFAESFVFHSTAKIVKLFCCNFFSGTLVLVYFTSLMPAGNSSFLSNVPSGCFFHWNLMLPCGVG